MKVGDYIRTKWGIQKIYEIDEHKTKWKYLCKCKNQDGDGCIDLCSFCDENIIKSSPNIIDLIEVGDYVNGLKITLINEPSMANCNKRLLYAEDEEGYLIKMFDKQDIKSIVTREQFEAMQYKVGE